MSRWNKEPLSMPTNTVDERELSSGEASTGGIDFDSLQPNTSPSRELPPRVIELPSNGSHCISRRALFHDKGVPDFDETESSDLVSLDDLQRFDDLVTAKIEVADGVFMRLRGSQETQAAWDCGECIETMCFVCEIPLACVRDCDCVICPHCRLISPVDHIPLAAGFRRHHFGGVGLGIKL